MNLSSINFTTFLLSYCDISDCPGTNTRVVCPSSSSSASQHRHGNTTGAPWGAVISTSSTNTPWLGVKSSWPRLILQTRNLASILWFSGRLHLGNSSNAKCILEASQKYKDVSCHAVNFWFDIHSLQTAGHFGSRCRFSLVPQLFLNRKVDCSNNRSPLSWTLISLWSRPEIFG